MPTPVDPFLARGPMQVITESGERHLFVPQGAGTVIVIRLTPPRLEPRADGWLTLRGDGKPFELRRIGHVAEGTFVDGIRVGSGMVLEVSPLRPDAAPSVRATTKVISLQAVTAVTTVTEPVEPDWFERTDSATGTTQPTVADANEAEP
jgi:hypothetical protein